MMDGVSRTRRFLRIILPLCARARATGAYNFVTSWAMFLYLLVSSAAIRNKFCRCWSGGSPSATLTTIPSIILFLFFRRQIVGRFEAGAAEG